MPHLKIQRYGAEDIRLIIRQPQGEKEKIRVLRKIDGIKVTLGRWGRW